MKQQSFEARGSERWRQFEALLAKLDAREREAAPGFPALYRRVCQDLALARDRQFSRQLVERLNRLALRGHEHLYQARGPTRRQLADFVAHGFPAAVRGEWRLFLFNSLLFYGAGLTLALLIVAQPELAYSFLDTQTLADLESMYDQTNGRVGVPRDASSDVAMFGFYIWNNISIAFRTFAAGLAFGLGTLLIVVFNSIFFGVIFGHLTQAGSLVPLSSFVIAHGSFELTAILLAGVAGMRLGLSLVAPGNRSRLQALRDAGRRALPIVYGAGGMLLIAAAIEAFWSPRMLPLEIKYGVGAAMWVLVFGYLLLAGRARAD